MKIAFISDIHGVPSTLSAALMVIDTLGYDKLVLLGDLLYHGPRNGVPDFYDPVRVAAILNERKENIIAVRGNCDAEVDQMMVEFPIMEDYKVLEVEGCRLKVEGGGSVCPKLPMRLFLTHGHLYNENRWPKSEQWLRDGESSTSDLQPSTSFVLVHGHTHIPELKNLTSAFRIFNPGSVSLPKGGSSRSFGYFDGTDFKHYTI